MSDKAQAKWDYSRFLATLNYFGEIPFLGSFRWLQRWVGQSSTFPGSTLSAMKQKVLIVEAADLATSVEVRSSEIRSSEIGPAEDNSDKSILLGSKLSGLLQQKRGKSTNFLIYNGPHQQLQDTRWNELQKNAEAFHEPTEKTPSNLEALIRSVDTVVLLGTSDRSNWMHDAVSSYQEARDGSSLDNVVQCVFDFSETAGDLAAWGALDDVVMGGVSQGSFFKRGEHAVFTGNVSTENSGGFSSVRTQNFEPPFNLAGWSGLQLRVKGDGQRYKFIARNSSGWDSPAYIYGVNTLKDEWTTIRIPFESMVPTFRARSVADAPPFDPAKVFSFQLMLSKFEVDRQLNPQFSAGPFELLVGDISVYRPRKGVPLIVVGLQSEEVSSQQQAVLENANVAYRFIQSSPEQTEIEGIEPLAEAIASALN